MKIQDVIHSFNSLEHQENADIALEKLAPSAFLLSPKNSENFKFAKKIPLTFAGIIHGNELAGAAVVLELAEYFLNNPDELLFPVAFLLGNPEAAARDIRFQEKDLNRCFGSTGSSTEEKRARTLSSILLNTAYFLDFHQTRVSSLTPFFISPYTPRMFSWARLIGPHYPIVTRWSGNYSPAGSSSDEFVKNNGGTGLTLELGQNGFEPRQIAAGVLAGIQAVRAVAILESQRSQPVHLLQRPPRVYLQAERMFSANPEALMEPGYVNFSPIARGSIICKQDNIVAPTDGFVLFPKYDDGRPDNRQATLAMDLCRIVKEISLDELPERPFL